MGVRKEEDKGVRLISASRGWIRNSVKFAWHSPNGQLWRSNLSRLADILGFTCISDFSARFGPNWAYHLADVVMDVGSWERYQIVDGELIDRTTGLVLFDQIKGVRAAPQLAPCASAHIARRHLIPLSGHLPALRISLEEGLLRPHQKRIGCRCRSHAVNRIKLENYRMNERPERKELRMLFTPEAYERLERQCALLDVPASTWVRALAMEK